MEFLKDLSPQTVQVIVLFWALRELLGFLSKIVKTNREQDRLNSISENDLKGFQDLLREVSTNIKSQTEAMREVFFEMKLMRKNLEDLSSDVEGLKRERPGS